MRPPPRHQTAHWTPPWATHEPGARAALRTSGQGHYWTKWQPRASPAQNQLRLLCNRTRTHTHFNTANAFFRRGSKSWLKTWTFSPSCMKPFQRLYCEIVTSEEQYSPRRIWDTAGLYDTGHDWSLPVLSLTLTSTWCKLPFNASPTKSADKIRSIVDYFHTDLIPHP